MSRARVPTGSRTVTVKGQVPGTLAAALFTAGREYLTGLMARSVSMSDAARKAGLNRTDLYKVMARYKVQQPKWPVAYGNRGKWDRDVPADF